MSGIGSDDSKKGPSTGSSEGNFSIDHDRSVQLEVPSITKLLDRRKLDPKLDQPPPASPTPKPEIRPARREADRRAEDRLEVIDESGPALPHSSHELARSWKSETGASWVVLLLPEGEQFKARRIAGGDRQNWSLWTGFQWGAKQAPAVFAELLQTRVVALTQRSTEEDAKALRAALLLPDQHHLFVVAAGPLVDAPAFLLMSASPDALKVKAALKKLGAMIKNARV